MPKILPIVLLCLASFAANAERLRLVADTWSPYVDESLPDQGLAINLVSTILAKAGYETALTIESWSRALEGTRLGVYDVAATIWYTDDRARDLAFSAPYLVNDIRLIKKKDSAIQFDRLDDLRGLLIGTEKDFAYPPEFLASQNLIRIPHPAILPALSELLKGQLDLVIGDRHVIDYTLRKFMPNEAKSLEFLPKSVGQRELYMGVSKTNPRYKTIVADFNRTLRAMKQDRSYQRILDAHQFGP